MPEAFENLTDSITAVTVLYEDLTTTDLQSRYPELSYRELRAAFHNARAHWLRNPHLFESRTSVVLPVRSSPSMVSIWGSELSGDLPRRRSFLELGGRQTTLQVHRDDSVYSLTGRFPLLDVVEAQYVMNDAQDYFLHPNANPSYWASSWERATYQPSIESFYASGTVPTTLRMGTTGLRVTAQAPDTPRARPKPGVFASGFGKWEEKNA